MKTKATLNKTLGLSPELFWTISSAIVLGAFFLGIYIGKASFDREKSDYYEQNKVLKFRIDTLNTKLDSINNSKLKLLPTISDIFVNGSLNQGLSMGINTSEGKTDWAKITNSELCMDYPDAQAWGSVFITVGISSSPQAPVRKAMDFSPYTTLLIELKGNKGETILLGLKDNLDPDNGMESKYPITLNGDWSTYKIDLRENFQSADLKQLYVVTEFIFAGHRQSVCVRKIQFTTQ